MKTLVVDGTNILMRAVKASERMDTPLSVEIDGEEVVTAPVFLFVTSFSKHVRNENPDRIVVCWDGGRSRHRVNIYPDYKMDRLERTDEKKLTFGLAKEFLSLNQIHHIEMPEVEADDLVAAYTRVAQVSGEVVILSGDKDFLQLIDDGVTQVRPGVKPEKWGIEEVQAKFGCHPKHLPMLMALTGDVGDGVPGIPGFGDKTAFKYLDSHDWSWEKILATADEGEDKKLAGQREALERNLALINLQEPIDSDIESGFIPMFRENPVLFNDITQWLLRYKFDSVLSRFQSGSLWKEPVQGTLV